MNEHWVVGVEMYRHRTAEYNPLVTWIAAVVCACGELFEEDQDGGRNDAVLVAFREHRRTPDAPGKPE